MQVSDSALDKLNEDERFDDCVASSADAEAAMVGLVQDAEGVSKVVFDLTFSLHANFVITYI